MNSETWHMKGILVLLSLLAACGAAAMDLRGVFPARVKTVGVVMPASVMDRAKFDAGVAALRAAGYRVKLAPRLKFDGLASPQDRAADLADMWTDPEVDLVLCARGGSLVERIVPYIDWDRLRTRPGQTFLGFSDITVLHNALLKEGVGRPVSGPMISSFPRMLPETRDWLVRALDGRPQPPVRLRVLRAGVCSGLPCGGHAHRFLIANRLGVSGCAKGKVVFLESEESIGLTLLGGTLDYMATSGVLDGCAGVVFGDMTPGLEGLVRADETEADALSRARGEVERMKRRFADRMACPVYDGFDYGHGRVNLAVDHLRRVSVDADGTMRWE